MKDSFLHKIDNTWTLFLDRDGVINTRRFGGYITKPDEFEFIPGVLESLKYFATVFSKIVIVTNQQGVGKGIMTEEELVDLHEYMLKKISKAEGRVDDIFYCTKLANEPNNCRKPSRFMANKAVGKYPDIQMHRSIMIGDSLSDIEFGKNSNMHTVFITSSGHDSKAEELADYSFNSLHSFYTSIKELSK